jgi:sensor histidine kinase YesM
LKQKRFRIPYWQVLVGVVAFGLVGYLIYFAANGFELPQHDEEVPGPNANPESGWRGLHDFIYYVTVIFFSLNLFYGLLKKRKRILHYLKIVALIIGVAFLYKAFLYFFFPIVLHNRHENVGSVFIAMQSYLVPLLIVSFIVAYAVYVRESLKEKRVLEAQKLQLEAQISQANFNFLKAQINPHFLHNTLNFLYAKSLPYSPELSEGILILSDIMRYALNQGYQKEGKAPLKDEVEHLENVIRISQLRYNNELTVSFIVTGELEGHLIVPFVLITLVENAFKHGDIRNEQHPIDIRLEVIKGRLKFYCHNRKKPGSKALTTGIGIDNITKRLELAYGTGFKLITRDESEFYTIELIIEKL